jgi:DedD protein
MDSGLKERLIGAAVLIAIGVWLIPWVLDGPDRPPSVDPDIGESLQLPSFDDSVPGPTRTQTIALSGSPEDRGRDGPNTNEPSTARAQTSDLRPAADSDAGKPIAAPSPNSADAVRKQVTDPGGQTINEGTDSNGPQTPSPQAATGPWLVQLGSFSDADNARRLASRVSTFGFSADVTTYGSGARTLHRVRVGPGRSRAAAEAMASSLVAHGFVAQVVSED